MKPWGTSGRGALLAVLLLVLSGAVFPPRALGQANVVSGTINDCAPSFDPVGARVTLVDVHSPPSDRNTQASPGSGFFTFSGVQPSFYKLRVSPDEFTHFAKETLPFRLDGITDVPPQRVCVDKMPDKDRKLNLTIVDAARNTASETVTFQEFSRANEDVTARGINGYDHDADDVKLATRPLGWSSETLTYSDNTTPIGGIPLKRGPGMDYDYNESQAFNGTIHILNLTVQTRLENTLFNRAPKGFLNVTYKNVSQSSQLAHGQIVYPPLFFRSGTPIVPYNATIELNLESGALHLNDSTWRYGSSGNALRADYWWSSLIRNALVTVRFAPEDEPIALVVTTPPSGPSEGKVSFDVWDNASFEVKVEATGYLTALEVVAIAGSDVNRQVALSRGFKVRAYAWDLDGNRAVTAGDGLTGALINTDETVNEQIQVLKPVVVDNLLTFNAYNGTWRLIVDANGRRADARDVPVNGANVAPFDVFLQKSWQELVRTEIAFNGRTDWNNITVWRNLTLLPDTSMPGLEYPEVRDIRWQLDLNFGNRDGDLNPLTELPAFRSYLQGNGPFYVVTDNLLTVNGMPYNSTGYTVLSVSDAGPPGNITIATRANYTLKQIATNAIPLNKPRYFVNVTTIADKNVSVYQNFSYLIQLPKGYEMTSKTTTGNVVTRRFVEVEVDPGIDAVVQNPKANLVVERSINGIARARVEGPVGKFYPKISEPNNYLAWVANNTAVVFSANETTDRQNEAINAKDATFDWRFRYQLNDTNLTQTRTGIWTTFDFGSLGTNYTVNLTVTQVNPDNTTWREINVTVDNLPPTARFTTNRTSGPNPSDLPVREDLVTKFDGATKPNDSFDLLWGTEPGEIAEWNWDFDSDGIVDRTGRVVTFNYSKPGTYKMNLTVVDRVGHESLNATMDVTVLDTTPPIPNFVTLDENNSWREVTQLTEGKYYWFNASQTTDNSLNRTQDNVNLTYTFNWGDPGPLNKTGPFRPSDDDIPYVNVTWRYVKHGEYTLRINATDASGNRGWLNRTLVVQANASAHPDLSIVTGSLKITPTSPEEGQLTTFRFTVQNAEGKSIASDLKLQVAVIIGRTEDNVTSELTGRRYLKPDGTETPTIEPGKNVTVEFKWAPPTLGNKSLKIKIWDGEEPTAWVTGANEITTSLVVREAGWKIWAWVGAFLFIIIGLPTIYYIVRKFRAGELRLPRRRREEGEEEEEEEDEDEDEEDDRKVAEDRKKRL